MKILITKYMTLILIALAAIFAGLAAIMQYRENDEVSKENSRLQQELLHYARGGDEVPALTASVVDNSVLVYLRNPDDKYPMINVKVKIRESLLPDIGTLYPNVCIQITMIQVPANTKDETYYFVIWYNNSKALVVDLDLKRNKEGTLLAVIKYLDENDREFIPNWQSKPKENRKPHTYNPRLHSYL
jgi:hypothetical protein